MRHIFAALVALGTILSGFATGTINAQEVPVLGENGWILPTRNTSDGLVKPSNGSQQTSQTDASSANSSAGSYEAAIYEACARHGCDPEQLIRVMYCESGGNPNAVGPNGELGIFQVDPVYWGYMDSWEQIEFAASMFSKGLGYHWICQ